MWRIWRWGKTNTGLALIHPFRAEGGSLEIAFPIIWSLGSAYVARLYVAGRVFNKLRMWKLIISWSLSYFALGKIILIVSQMLLRNRNHYGFGLLLKWNPPKYEHFTSVWKNLVRYVGRITLRSSFVLHISWGLERLSWVAFKTYGLPKKATCNN